QLEAAQAKQVESKKGSGAEVVALRRERDELHAKLTAELQTAAESTRRASEAESHLNQSATELARVKADLQQERSKQAESEASWRRQLEAAQAKQVESKKG